MLGSIKSHAALTILIPMIALGVPLMGTFWATARRFILGQRLFRPENAHFHHRLLRLGYTHRRAVLVLYGITIGMGLLSLLLVHAHDDQAALLLLLVGVTMIFGIRKLGYLKYLAVDKIVSWVEGISDELGIKRDRRKFLAYQMAISESKNMDEFWSRVVSAGQLLKLDYLELRLGTDGHNPQTSNGYSWHSGKGRFDPASLDPQRTLYICLPL